MNGWSFGNVMTMVGDAAKTGFNAAKEITVKTVETVQDPEFQMKVKAGISTAVDATKKGAVYVYEQATDPENHAAVKEGLVKVYEGTKTVAANAVHTVQDPEFQNSVKETAGKVIVGTKEACFTAITTVQDPHFQEKVKDNLTKGVESAKKLITGNSEQVETLHMRPEDNPYNPDHQSPTAGTNHNDQDLRTGSTGLEKGNESHPEPKKRGDYGDAFSDKDLKEF